MAVLFDLDNTLTPRRQCVEAFAALFAEDWAGRFEVPAALPALFVELDQGGYNPRRAAALLERLVWSDPPAVAELEAHWQERFPHATCVREGVHELLRALRERSVPLGCVTNGGVPGQTAKLERLGLTPYFGSIVISDAMGCKKPDPRIFQRALDELEVPAEAAWFVGDHPVNDVIGARRLGMRAVWMRDGAHVWPEDEPGPEHEVQGFSALAPLLLGAA